MLGDLFVALFELVSSKLGALILFVLGIVVVYFGITAGSGTKIISGATLMLVAILLWMVRS